MRLSLLSSLPLVSLCCVLCPLRVPPRPRPLDQFKIPSLPKIETESVPQFCNLTQWLPVQETCRSGISKILCSADALIDAYHKGCPGPEDTEQCSKCERSKPDNFWVIQWFDSIGKPPHGISEGNYYWLGDYEICHSLNDGKKFHGQYCWVRLEVPDSLVEAGCPQTDPLEIIYGVCAPIECKEYELEAIARAYAPYKVRVSCEHEEEISWGATALLTVILVWKAFIWIMTFLSGKDWAPDWFHKFNTSVNGKRTLSTKRNHDIGLHVIHGLLVCSYMMLIAGNVYNMMLPYIENVAFAFDEISNPFAHFINNYSYQTDGLIALTCFLTASLMHGHINTLKEAGLVILNALLRFWPVYAFLVLYMTILFPYATSGPMWIHGDISQRCAQSWWKNLLFINFLSVEDTCLDFGYVVSLMTWYFALITILCFVAKNNYRLTIIICGVSLSISILYSFLIIYINDLPPAPLLTAEPIERAKMQALLDYVVINPIARLSSAMVGLLFALIPRRNPDAFLRLCLALLAGGCALFVSFFLFNYSKGSYMHPLALSFYGAVHRPLWAFSLLSLAFLCTCPGFETIEAFLGWRLFSPLAKRIIPALIISEPLILHFYSALHRPSFATHWSTVYAVLCAGVVAIKISLILDIFISRPIRNIFIRNFHKEAIPEEVEDGIELEEKES